MAAAGMARAPGARPGYLSAHAPRPTAAPARRTAPPPRRRRARAAAAAEAAEAEAEAGGDDAVCAPAFVSVDNRKNKNFTVMEVSVVDYPGLMRVLAWVLNGLDLVAQNAVLSTSADGVARNTFWLSTRAGAKLSDAGAERVAERVDQYVAYCSPAADPAELSAWDEGPISIDNAAHEVYTVVSVAEGARTPGTLLELAGVLQALNVTVLQGVIQGCSACGDDVPALPERVEGTGRLFKLWVRDAAGEKLRPGHARALLYALGSALGLGQGFRLPLRPPGR